MPTVSERKKEELRLKAKSNIERKEYIDDLWKRRGEEFIIRLSMMNLPVMDADHPGELQFCHVRYRKKDEIRSEWLKKWKVHKKWSTISEHWWSFYPIGIYPKTHSIDPKNQRYVF